MLLWLVWFVVVIVAGDKIMTKCMIIIVGAIVIDRLNLHSGGMLGKPRISRSV